MSSWLPWFILGLLLILCVFRGLHLVAGFVRPPDIDSLRDVGFIQGFVDGNWFGDPAYTGEWRYPPVISRRQLALRAMRKGQPSRTLRRKLSVI
jgi:hypothetical protein